MSAAGDQIDIFKDDDPRSDKSFMNKYRHFYIDDLLFGGDGIVYD